jgi:hypothetical protein
LATTTTALEPMTPCVPLQLLVLRRAVWLRAPLYLPNAWTSKGPDTDSSMAHPHRGSVVTSATRVSGRQPRLARRMAAPSRRWRSTSFGKGGG